MCCCDKNNFINQMQSEVINSLFDEIFNELLNVLQDINRTSMTANNLHGILSRLRGPSRKIYSFCRGMSMLDPSIEQLAKEMLFLSNVLEEVSSHISMRSIGDNIPTIDLCLQSLEICSLASGLCVINPLLGPLARCICLLAKIVCAVIPPPAP